MESSFITLIGKGSIVFALLVLLFAMERAFPFADWSLNLHRLFKNFALATLNLLASPLIVIPVTALAVSHTPDWRPELLTGWSGLAFDLLLLDCWIYWWHRANHVLPFLWRFHEVHHLDETLDTSSALRFHFGEVVLSSLIRAVVIVIAAVPLSSVIVFETMVVAAALFHHSNLKLPSPLEKALSLVVVTPSIHWVHHHALQADTDSNYANVLSLWDRVFRSQSRTIRTADLVIGVEGRRDRQFIELVKRPLDPP